MVEPIHIQTDSVVWFVFAFAFMAGIVFGAILAKVAWFDNQRGLAFRSARDMALPGTGPQTIIAAAKEYEFYLLNRKAK